MAQDLRKVEVPLLWLQGLKSSTEGPYEAMTFGRIVVFDKVVSGGVSLFLSGSALVHSGLAWLPLPT